jgi:hypothetical protein
VSRSDRAVRRARRHLADGEGIVATALGIEADGRRRHVVLLTDRRLLVSNLRTDPPVQLDPDGTRGEFDPTGDLLTLRDDDRELVLRGVEPVSARQLLGLLGQRRPGHRLGEDEPGNVRIVS